MNENLNLVELLKDCPKGTKLYSTLFGEVKLNTIIINNVYSIEFEVENGELYRVASDGRYLCNLNGECILFPSKDQRDWSKFNPIENGTKLADEHPNLESLWHDASEEPLLERKEIIFLTKQGIAYISERVDGMFPCMLEESSWGKYVILLRISKWAYLDDLLPKQFRKSEQLKGGKK